MSTIKSQGGPLVHLMATCLDCKHKHEVHVSPGGEGREMGQWYDKHRGHRIEFISKDRTVPRDLDDKAWMSAGEAPWWLEHAEFKPNADIKLSYAASAAMTFTSVNSLASSAGLTAGASALAVNNLTNKYLDYFLACFFTNNTGAAPTVNTTIDVWAYRNYDDTPTYPDTLLGTDATKTITTTNILQSALKAIGSMTIAATTSQVNALDGGAITGYFGGVTPQLWSVFVTHNSGQTLHSSGNTVSYSGSYLSTIG